MQLFTHLLSSYLQGMGNFFSALQGRAGEGPPICSGSSVGVAKDKRAGKSTDAGTHSTVTYSKSIVDGTPTTATLKEHKTSIFP